jgi:hypothetical protein
MTESEFQSQVRELCRWLGLLAYHTHDSQRSDPGFPDLVIVGARGVLFRELKTEVGKTSPMQDHWIACLNAAGQDAAVWRPHQLQTDVRRELSALGPIGIPAPDTRARARRKASSMGRVSRS